MKKISFLLAFLFCSSLPIELFSLSMLTKNDPYPMYVSYYDPYLATWIRQCLKGFKDCPCYETFSFAISPFYQKANSGRNFDKETVLLGDLEGTWNMLSMVYGKIPTDQPLGLGQQLGCAKMKAFADIAQDLTIGNPNALIIDDDNLLTSSFVITSTFIGNFSVPIKYKKVGFRIEVAIQPCADFGITLQAGFAEIRQTVTGFIDIGKSTLDEVNSDNVQTAVPEDFKRFLPIFNCVTSKMQTTTCPATPCNPNLFDCNLCTTFTDQIQEQFMEQEKADLIFTQSPLNFENCDFEETGVEDVRLLVWWRHPYCVNYGREPNCWPRLLVMPAFQFAATFPTGKKKDRGKLFSLPFGNDGHYSVAFDASITLDFAETILIAFKAGVTHFLARDVMNFRIPTHRSQTGIFPYATEARVNPGNNYSFVATLYAYRFVDHLSAHAEYIFVKHEEDKIELKEPDPAFLPKVLECRTKFSSQFINTALNYEISPNIWWGLLVQWPLGQRNAYRSTTVLGTLRMLF